MLTLKKFDEVFFEVEVESVSTSIELREYLSYNAKNFFFHPLFRKKIWNGKISFFKDSKFPIGLLKHFLNFCEEYGYDFKLDFNVDCLEDKVSVGYLENFCKDILKDYKNTLRDYQIESFIKLIKNKRGVVELAVNSGKSLIIYLLIRYLLKYTDKKILLIVPNISLCNQMFSDFVEYGWKDAKDYVSIINSDSDMKDISKRFQISTWQSLMLRSIDKVKDENKKRKIVESNLKKKEFLSNFGSVIVDEVHGSSFKSKIVQDVLSNLVNAEYRFGCTGTLPTEKLDLLTIYGYLGDKLVEVKNQELIDRNISSKIEIINVVMKYPEDMIIKSGESYQEEIDKIINYSERNKIFKFIIDNIDKDKNFLILFQRIEQLENLEKYLKEIYKDIKILKFIGDVEVDEREKIRKSIENLNGVILLGTYGCLQTGISIKKIHHMILGSGSKSRIRVIQSIGRGLRKHYSKEKVFIWDLVDCLCWKKKTGSIGKNYLFKQWEERLKIYKEEGFSFKNISVKLMDL